MISDLFELIFANKYAIWVDTACVTGGLLWLAWKSWSIDFFLWYIPYVILALVPMFLSVILSLKGEVDGWV